MQLRKRLMSSEATQNYPTFVSITTAHMSGANSDDQRGVDQDSIHQGNITRHQDENTITITAFHHDQANSGISTDSDSHQSHVQDSLHSLASPGEQDAEIYEVRDGSNADEATHVWVKEEVRFSCFAILLFQLRALA